MESSKKDKVLSGGFVTTLWYDLAVKDDTNINQEIKDILLEKGWNFTILEQRTIRYFWMKSAENEADTPKTTAWKEGVTPKEAINEFHAAIEAYNSKHLLDTPVVLGRGHAFAVCNNEYDAIKIS